VDEATTVGHKRLLRLASPATTDQIRIRITSSRLEPTLAEIGLFKQSLPAAPVISNRTKEGIVTLAHPHKMPIVYTVDGTAPTPDSRVYDSPIALTRGGTVQAAVLTPDRHVGLVAIKTSVGLAPIGWKVAAVEGAKETSAEFPAVNAIDANGRTFWRAQPIDGQPTRVRLVIDMGQRQRIAGFAYLPRQDWRSEGVVDRYAFETSLDGTNWNAQVADGTFGNIRNNPVLQEVTFAPVEARFFRFTAMHDVKESGWVGAAEITVLPAP
jgi:alpha-L-fucosidase